MGFFLSCFNGGRYFTFDTRIVPVGKDQIQHVEIARDIALKVNNEWGEILPFQKRELMKK